MKIRLKKIDAARNQLKEAISLWFHDGDLASMHMLACSAHQIVSDINQKLGGRDLIYDSLLVKDEYRSEWIKTIKGPYNFLKHADKDADPEGELEFDSLNTEFFILFTILGLELLGYEKNIMEAAFIVRYMLIKPEFLKEGKNPFSEIPIGATELAKVADRKTFLTSYMMSKQ